MRDRDGQAQGAFGERLQRERGRFVVGRAERRCRRQQGQIDAARPQGPGRRRSGPFAADDPDLRIAAPQRGERVRHQRRTRAGQPAQAHGAARFRQTGELAGGGTDLVEDGRRAAHHIALATGLHGALAADGCARVVAVSSSGHQLSPIVWDDVHFAFRPYDPWLAYGQAKTANVLFAVEATRRRADDGITANAVMPGAVFTNLQRHTEGGRGSGGVPAELIKTVGQGAATAVLAATSPLLEGVGGRYFADCNEAEVLDRRGAPLQGVARYALDPAGARRPWELSEEMLAGAG